MVETDEDFFKRNLLLKDVYKEQKSQGGSGAQSSASICLDLFDLTSKNLGTNGKLQPYIDYISAVINMYCHMCISRNSLGVRKLKEIGLTFDHVIAAVSQQTGDKKGKKAMVGKDKIEPLDKKFISAYIFAARVMYVDVALFPQL